MKAKTMIAGLLGTTLLATAAYAQNPAPADNTNTMAKPSAAATGASQQHMGQWRASKLMGVNVYNQGNEKLGDISELLIDNQGRIQGVVIGVGGFLGVGQRDVAVAFDKLQWVNTPVSSNTAANTQTAPAGSATSTASPAGTTTGAAGSTSATASNADRWYPDHAVLNATKDQLTAMPEFKYSR
ncbi:MULTISPECIES: PRC-barrel domain-containing protein [Rhodopseudomonas]|uniref:PRC-barrel domain protein n=1 Tax=Rhodopseudomonas palustris (strain DX-1) TaxID=652103 RepID=E6VLN8_RHOPX|nr:MULTISPECIES: PRC-barrel domain-containing protein [Rhodopseudomonas]NEW89325.1 PRC-barrel domain containing protein [Rhodopseudomonas sp. WA056]QDL98226.1 PRC-barrel domain containing protein [Rhodopseudomonas palustris]